MTMRTERNDQRRANRRLGLVLASIALAIFVGFLARVLWLGH